MERKKIVHDSLTRLAARMKKGDRKAAAALYDELSPKTYGFFFSRTSSREVAEDLSQDLFLKIVERIDGFDEGRGSFAVWFWQIARNMLIDHYREKKEIPFGQFDDDAVAALAVAETIDLEAKFLHEKLGRFLEELSEDERELFELRYIAEMSYKEISAMLERTEGALRIAALRVKEKIRKAFPKEH